LSLELLFGGEGGIDPEEYYLYMYDHFNNDGDYDGET
jgi:hypothetical protein